MRSSHPSPAPTHPFSPPLTDVFLHVERHCVHGAARRHTRTRLRSRRRGDCICTALCWVGRLVCARVRWPCATAFYAPFAAPAHSSAIYQNLFACGTPNCNTVSSSNACTGGCPPGSVVSGTSCSACPANTWASGGSSTSCTPCPADYVRGFGGCRGRCACSSRCCFVCGGLRFPSHTHTHLTRTPFLHAVKPRGFYLCERLCASSVDVLPRAVRVRGLVHPLLQQLVVSWRLFRFVHTLPVRLRA